MAATTPETPSAPLAEARAARDAKLIEARQVYSDTCHQANAELVRAVRRELAARGGGYGSLKAVADELDLVRSAVHRLLKQHPA